MFAGLFICFSDFWVVSVFSVDNYCYKIGPTISIAKNM